MNPSKSPSPSHLLERGEKTTPSPPHHSFSWQIKKVFQPSKLAITNPASISISLSASCSEPNVIFVEASRDSRSVIHQSDQNGESLPGLKSRKMSFV